MIEIKTKYCLNFRLADALGNQALCKELMVAVFLLFWFLCIVAILIHSEILRYDDDDGEENRQENTCASRESRQSQTIKFINKIKLIYVT